MYTSIDMLSNYVERYIKYQEKNVTKSNKQVVFLLLDKKFYMFYNEKSVVKPSDLPVHFGYNGIAKSNGIMYYYVAFDDNQKTIIFEKLKKYNITILDNKFNTLNFNQTSWENNSRDIYKQLFDPSKKYPFMNNVEIIQNSYGLFGGRQKNLYFSSIGINDNNLGTVINNVKNINKFDTRTTDSKLEKQSPKLNIELKPKINIKQLVEFDKNIQLASSLHFDVNDKHILESTEPINNTNEKGIKSNKSSIGVSIDELENVNGSRDCTPNKSISIDELENSEKNSINEITKLIKGGNISVNGKLSPEEHIVIFNNAQITNIIKKTDTLSNSNDLKKSGDKYKSPIFNRTVSDMILEEYEFI